MEPLTQPTSVDRCRHRAPPGTDRHAEHLDRVPQFRRSRRALRVAMGDRRARRLRARRARPEPGGRRWYERSRVAGSRNSPARAAAGSATRIVTARSMVAQAPCDGHRRAAAPASYRAPGSGVEPICRTAERDACGALMERALANQVAGRLDSAAQGLSRSPRSARRSTHDALHMAGRDRAHAQESRRGGTADLGRDARCGRVSGDRAQLLARPRRADGRARGAAGGALRARAADSGRARARARERAAPKRRRAPLRTASASAAIHLIGRMHARRSTTTDGCCDRLARLLEDERADRLGGRRAGPARAARRSTRSLDAASAALPRGGTHVFVGVHFDCARWIERADAARVIVFCFGGAAFDVSRPAARHRPRRRAAARARVSVTFASRRVSEAITPCLPPPIELREFRCRR